MVARDQFPIEAFIRAKQAQYAEQQKPSFGEGLLNTAVSGAVTGFQKAKDTKLQLAVKSREAMMEAAKSVLMGDKWNITKQDGTSPSVDERMSAIGYVAQYGALPIGWNMQQVPTTTQVYDPQGNLITTTTGRVATVGRPAPGGGKTPEQKRLDQLDDMSKNVKIQLENIKADRVKATGDRKKELLAKTQQFSTMLNDIMEAQADPTLPIPKISDLSIEVQETHGFMGLGSKRNYVVKDQRKPASGTLTTKSGNTARKLN